MVRWRCVDPQLAMLTTRSLISATLTCDIIWGLQGKFRAAVLETTGLG
jgi:hypothetical protein